MSSIRGLFMTAATLLSAFALAGGLGLIVYGICIAPVWDFGPGRGSANSQDKEMSAITMGFGTGLTTLGVIGLITMLTVWCCGPSRTRGDGVPRSQAASPPTGP